MKLFFILAGLLLMQLSFASESVSSPRVGDLLISCTQLDHVDSELPYTATVYASEDGNGTLVVTEDGVVILSTAIKTGGNGDTFATATAQDVMFYVDAESMYSGVVEFVRDGETVRIEFESEELSGDNLKDFAACSRTPSNWNWTASGDYDS